jgi:hypothetical protein
MILAGRIGTIVGVAAALAALVLSGVLDGGEALLTACGIAGLWVANHLPSRPFAAVVRTIVFGVWIESIHVLLDGDATFSPAAALAAGVIYAGGMAIAEAVTARMTASPAR